MKNNSYNNLTPKIIRILNAICLCIIGLVGISLMTQKELEFNAPAFVWVITFLISPIVASMIVDSTKKKYEFLEWDMQERKKKSDFLSNLTAMIFTFAYLSIFTFTWCCYEMYYNPYTFGYETIISIFIGIWFLVNALYTVKLHHKLYSRFLVLDFVVEKPDNWESKATPSLKDEMDNYWRERMNNNSK